MESSGDRQSLRRIATWDHDKMTCVKPRAETENTDWATYSLINE